MRHVVTVILFACACLCGAVVALADDGPIETGTTTETTDANTTPQMTQAQAQRSIDRYRHRTWHWQRVMEQPLTLTLPHPPADLLAHIQVWKRISIRVQNAATHPPHLNAWTCIHRYEGSWTDAGSPYYGGLQMDMDFQRNYGLRLLRQKGTADHWTPLEQMWVAERALAKGRSFGAWPNSARLCHLI